MEVRLLMLRLEGSMCGLDRLLLASEAARFISERSMFVFEKPMFTSAEPLFELERRLFGFRCALSDSEGPSLGFEKPASGLKPTMFTWSWLCLNLFGAGCEHPRKFARALGLSGAEKEDRKQPAYESLLQRKSQITPRRIHFAAGGWPRTRIWRADPAHLQEER